jgi:hypothetical protein
VTDKRKSLSQQGVIQVLLNQGVVIPCPCPECERQRRRGIGRGRYICYGNEAIREHLHQLGMDGKDKIESIEERLTKSPVAAVYEVIDAIAELRRRAYEIQRLEREARGRECPSCGWRSNG